MAEFQRLTTEEQTRIVKATKVEGASIRQVMSHTGWSYRKTTRRPMPEVNAFFEKLEGLFAKEDFTKAQVVEAIKDFIPNFEHEEKGKNLDQKM